MKFDAAGDGLAKLLVSFLLAILLTNRHGAEAQLRNHDSAVNHQLTLLHVISNKKSPEVAACDSFPGSWVILQYMLPTVWGAFSCL